MSLPKPQPGLVVAYSYLWADEHRKGAEEGRKNRPCAIIAARRVIAGHEIVTVIPITHTHPASPEDAVEIPASLKAHLGLDHEPSWVVLTETNDFLWPGSDLRSIPGKPRQFTYGMLPPRFFAHIRDKLLRAHHRLQIRRVPRT